MSDASIGTPEQLRDPNYTPPIAKAVPLGIQHVLAMFVSNVTPAIIVCGAPSPAPARGDDAFDDVSSHPSLAGEALRVDRANEWRAKPDDVISWRRDAT